MKGTIIRWSLICVKYSTKFFLVCTYIYCLCKLGTFANLLQTQAFYINHFALSHFVCNHVHKQFFVLCHFAFGLLIYSVNRFNLHGFFGWKKFMKIQVRSDQSLVQHFDFPGPFKQNRSISNVIFFCKPIRRNQSVKWFHFWKLSYPFWSSLFHLVSIVVFQIDPISFHTICHNLQRANSYSITINE